MKIEALEPADAQTHAPLERELTKRLQRFPSCLKSAVSQNSVDPPEPFQDRIALRIGLAGEEGKLRQIIHTEGVIEAVHVFEALRSLGYVPAEQRRPYLRVHCLYVANEE